MGKRGQVWSMDLIIGVIIFLLIVGVAYFFMDHRANRDLSKLQIESQMVADKLTGDDPSSIIEQQSLNEERLNDLAALSYEELKQKFGLNDDFCIVLTDQNGSVILMTDNGGKEHVGIGNPNLTINLTLAGVTHAYNCGDIYP